MAAKAAPIVDWISTNLPALTWTTLKLKYMDLFIEAKISPSKIDDGTEFTTQIVESLSKTIQEKYNLELPKELMN